MKEGWKTKHLIEICKEITDGSHFSPKSSETDKYPYITVRDISESGIDFKNCKFINKDNYDLLLKNGCKPNCGDLLFSKDGTVGKVALVDFEKEFVVLSSLAILRPKREVINSELLRYILLHPNFLKTAVEKKTGVAIRRIILKNLKQIQVNYPSSLDEQKQIVAILDKAFAAIDQAKANIEKNIQNAQELFQSKLNQIFSQKGEGWVTEDMVDVCSVLTCGVASTPKYVDEEIGVPFLSAQNVKNGKVILEKFKFISQDFHEHLTKKNKPQKGDILYSRVGAKFGEAGVVEHDFEFSVYVSVTLIRPIHDKLNNYYLKYYLNSPVIKSLAKKSITSSGVPNLNVKTVRKFPVHYPSLEKQLKTVEEIKNLENAHLKILKNYEKKSDSLIELKKSILQKAFAGGLT